MKPVISVENLSKAYRIGLKEEVPDTLVGAVSSLARSPLRGLQRLRRLDTFSQTDDADDILWALRDVSFEVQEGEVVGIIGRNGAGKSTLLKILSRITEPTHGRAVIHGRVSSLLEVGTGFHPELTGRENIYMNGTILGMRKREIDRKFDEIVDFSGVEKFLDTPIKRYSSGMQVRLAFAVAAHLEPEILIVDEVLAVGDADFQQKCLGKMQDVAAGGRTVLFVSHNMGVIASLCERAIVLSHGRVGSIGQAAEQVTHYMAALRRIVTTDLALRDDRTGSGEVRVTSLDFLNEDGAPVCMTTVGAPITIALRVKTNEDAGTITKVAISCYGSTGTKLFHIDNLMKNCRVRRISKSGDISCHIPRLPLPSGHYHFNVLVAHNGTTADHIDSAATLQVVEGDYFGAGAVTSAHGGLVFVDHDWN